MTATTRNSRAIALLLFAALHRSTAWVPTNTRIASPRPTALFSERRFAQPNQKKKFGGDAKLATIHKERLSTAGRVGTKRFVDPCKVFIGNLPFTADEKQMEEFILGTMGQSRLVLHSSKVIHDWKTGKSKGFGFMVFSDPIYATVCMEVCSGKKLDGRPLSVSQGKKKDQENQLYIKKKKKAPETDEEAAIASALELAESEDDEIPVFGGSDDDLELDAKLFGITADDEGDDDDYDGIFLERKPIYADMDENMNREQRREAARRMKRTKLPSKGFG